MKLFHISESKNIEFFIPRISKRQWNFKNYVWAVEGQKVHNYLVPRNCPRICIDDIDLDRVTNYLGIDVKDDTRSIIFVPTSWHEKIGNTPLYQYEFNINNFRQIDRIAGYYVSEVIEYPIKLETIENSFDELNSLKVELVSLDLYLLTELRKFVVKNIQNFSIIRWSNI